jgi:AcrR family transcriptional regulator
MNRRSGLTNDEIVARARAVFVERGYAVRTQQIAAAVGLTWGAIALRFGTKQALFTQAMAQPAQGAEPAGCDQADAADEAELPELLERLRRHLWVRWPQRLQWRVAAAGAAGDGEEPRLARRVAQALQAQAERGTVRTDIGAEPLAGVVLALLTGDVAQRFVAHERTLPADTTLIDGLVRLLSPSPARAGP